MEAKTFLLWFQLDKALLKDNLDDVLSRVSSLPGLFSPGPWTTLLQQRLGDGSYIYTIVNNDGSHVVMRLFTSGFLTFDLQCQAAVSTTNNNRPLLMSMIRDRTAKMKKHLGKMCLRAKSIDCPLYRSCEAVWPYVVTGDERLMQMDFTELLYETNSPWQNIKIYKSRQCGNVLYLDDDVMLGESDLVYTETVLGLDRNDFTDSTVLVLGGGDGGILHELITRSKPAFVTMVEIDEEVIKACKTHMRSVCGNEMDQYEGTNYKVLIGDCVQFLNEAIKKNQTFDYVVNDLTEYPVDKDDCSYDYDYVTTRAILDMSIKVLAPSGKYLARGNTLSSTYYTSELKAQMGRLGLKYSMMSKHIPSFNELYCFIEAWKAVEPS